MFLGIRCLGHLPKKALTHVMLDYSKLFFHFLHKRSLMKDDLSPLEEPHWQILIGKAINGEKQYLPIISYAAELQ